MRKATALAYPRLPALSMFALVFFVFQSMELMLNARVSASLGAAMVAPYFSAGLLCNALGYIIYAFWAKRLPAIPSLVAEAAAAAVFFAAGLFLPTGCLLLCTCLCMLPLGMLGGFVHLSLAYAIRGDKRGGLRFGCAVAAAVLAQFILQRLVKNTVASVVIVSAAAAALVFLCLRFSKGTSAGEERKTEKAAPPAMWLMIAVTALLSIAVGINEGLLTRVSATGVVSTTVLPRLIYAAAAVAAGFLSDLGNKSLLPLCAAIAMLLTASCGVLLQGSGASYLISFCLFYLLAGFYVVYFSLSFINAAPDAANPALCAGGGRIIRGLCVSVTALPSEWLLSHSSHTGVLLLMTGFSLAILVLAFIPPSRRTGRSAPAPKPPSLPRESFTNRENEVLDLIMDGKNTREISALLYISERTVKFHVTNILAKADCASCQLLRERYGGEESFRRQPSER